MSAYQALIGNGGIIENFHFMANKDGRVCDVVVNAIARAECAMRQAAKAEQWDGQTLWAGWPKELVESIVTWDTDITGPVGGYHGPRHWEQGRSCVEDIVGACGRALYQHFPAIDNLRRLHRTLLDIAVLFSKDIHSQHLTHLDVPIEKWRAGITSAGEKAETPEELFTAFVLSVFSNVGERIENEGWEHLRRISGTHEPEPIDQVAGWIGEPEAGGPATRGEAQEQSQEGERTVDNAGQNGARAEATFPGQASWLKDRLPEAVNESSNRSAATVAYLHGLAEGTLNAPKRPALHGLSEAALHRIEAAVLEIQANARDIILADFALMLPSPEHIEAMQAALDSDHETVAKWLMTSIFRERVGLPIFDVVARECLELTPHTEMPACLEAAAQFALAHMPPDDDFIPELRNRNFKLYLARAIRRAADNSPMTDKDRRFTPPISDEDLQRGLTTADCLPSSLSVVLRQFHPSAGENRPLVKAITDATVRAACSMRQAAKAERWDSKTLWAEWLERFKKSTGTPDFENTAPDGEHHGPRHWEHGRSCIEEMVVACGRALYLNFPSVEVLRPIHLTLRGVTEALSSDVYLGHLDGLDASFPVKEWNNYVRGTEKSNRVDEPWTNFTAFVLSRLSDVSARIENERWEHLMRISGTDEPEPSDQAPSMTGEHEADGAAPALVIPEIANPPLPAREQTDAARADSRGSHEPLRVEPATVANTGNVADRRGAEIILDSAPLSLADRTEIEQKLQQWRRGISVDITLLLEWSGRLEVTIPPKSMEYFREINPNWRNQSFLRLSFDWEGSGTEILNHDEITATLLKNLQKALKRYAEQAIELISSKWVDKGISPKTFAARMESAGEAIRDAIFEMLKDGVSALARGATTDNLEQALSAQVRNSIAREIDLYRRNAQLTGLCELPERDDVVEEYRATDESVTARADSRGSHEPARAQLGGATERPPLDTAKIGRWMDEEGYTNDTLAEKLHTSLRSITSMRNNGRLHGKKVVTKLANQMGCDPSDLYR